MRKTELKSILIFLFTLNCFLLASCKKTERKQYADDFDAAIKIGFSIDTLIVERWREDCQIFESTAKKSGASVIVQDAANSVTEQIKQIEYLINQNVDALVIIAKEDKSLEKVLQKAKAKNIPVISYDRLIRNSEISLYITVDSEKVGNLMADAILSVQKEGSLWCIYGSDADYNMALVDKGVRNRLSGEKISVDVKYFTPDWNYDIAYKKMNSLLDEKLLPSAVICGNDSIAENVIRAISEHKLGNSIPVVGQDAEILACRRISKGIQTATVYKPIKELAVKAAECACLLAKGTLPENLEGISGSIDNGTRNVPVIMMSPVLVTKENLSEMIVESGFHTADEIFR